MARAAGTPAMAIAGAAVFAPEGRAMSRPERLFWPEADGSERARRSLEV
jgi:hypothetical protein